MAGDFNKPATTDTYTAFASAVRDLAADLAKGLDPALVSTANIPTNTIRWNSAQNRDEKYNGSTWVVKSSLYSINISGNAATATLATSANAAPWSGVSGKPTTVGGYGITDMSSQVVSKASHLVGGVVGNIPYQTVADTTAMLAAGTASYILKANGAAAPTWVAQSTLAVGTAAACSGNAATATTAAACSGNAATATTAAACSGNAATATNAGNADTVDGQHASAFATAVHTHSYVPLDLGAGNYPIGLVLECVAVASITAGSTYTSSPSFRVLGTQIPAGTWRVVGPSVSTDGVSAVQRIA